MARTTVSHYKSRTDDPQGVGRDLHVDTVLTGRVVEHGSEIEKSRHAAHRAVELDGQIPESHLSLALVDLLFYWDFMEAEREINKARA